MAIENPARPAMERRAFTFELRAQDEDKGPKITGHAALFNVEADLLFFREQIEPGAFAESIKNDDIRALWNHDSRIVLGRNKAGTLVLREDDKGLWVEIDPPKSAEPYIESIRRGDVTQMSFGFFVKDARWEKKDGKNVRVLTKVELFDVSPVTFPAYQQTDVSVRSAEQIFADYQPASGPTPPGADATLELDLRRRQLETISKF